MAQRGFIFIAVTILAGAMGACGQEQTVVAPETPPITAQEIVLSEPFVTYRIGGGAPRRWDLATNFTGRGDGPFSIGYVPYEDGYAVFGVDLAGRQAVTVCFETGVEPSCFDVSSDTRHDLTFVTGEQTYKARLRAQTPAAVFPEAYRAANQGRIATIAPPFYELYNVAIALTPTAKANPGSVYTDTDYYRRLAAHFEPHREHRLIQRIDAALREQLLNYYILKTNAVTYEFDAQGRIVPSAVYLRGGFPGSQINEMAPYLEDLQAFADEADFLAFYEANRAVFDDQIAFFDTQIDIEGMLAWLKAQFPDADAYDSVKIVLSPLTGYVQFLSVYEEDGFRELQPHINFPYRTSDDLSPEADAVARGTLLFTEMNHGFIEPPAALRGAIRAAFEDLTFWIDPASDAATTYGTPLDAFDEYMNWALLSLYAHDRMASQDWQTYRARIVRVMSQNRGFPHFKAFNDTLVGLYVDREAGTTVVDLFPDMVAWAQTYRKTEAAPE